MFVSFEGVDGSGKSTQARLLAEHLTRLGHAVVLTREPGGSPGAEQIRRLVVEGAPDRWSAQTEILLFTAARRDHIEHTILPALEDGKLVISDRFADSTRVYQGATRGDLRQLVDRLHTQMIAFEPDITVIIDMDPEIALERGLARATGEDRFEEFGADFQHKLRAGFRALQREFPERIVIVDGAQSAGEIATQVADLVDARLKSTQVQA